MPDLAVQDIRDRTGPLHRLLGVTAAASDDEIAAAVGHVDVSHPLAPAASGLAVPGVRAAYEELVLASRRGERIRVTEDEAEQARSFAAQMGVELQPFQGQPGVFAATLIDSEAPAPIDHARSDLGRNRSDDHVGPGAPAGSVPGSSALSLLARIAHALRNSPATQIIAGLTVVAALAGMAWWVAPRPAPPPPGVLAAEEAKSQLRDALAALEALRERCLELDALARDLIGPSHRWHDVDNEPPPLAVAEWVRVRDRADARILLGYNRIAEDRNAAGKKIEAFETDMARLGRQVELSATEAQLGEAKILAQRIREVTESLATRATELRRLHGSP